jgi:uncharacterized membrane protein
MKRSVQVLDVLSLGSLAGLGAFMASVYGQLPVRIATHFDLHGTPNGWMDRGQATFGIGGLALALWALIRFSPRWLPASGGWRERAAKSPMAAVALLTTLLMVAVVAFTTYNALHPEASRGATLDVGLGAWALALSQILPRTRRNPILGVRTAFSLTSDENWLRANRFGSYAFALGGAACIACGLLGVPAAGIVAFVAAALAPVGYSWALAYRLPPEA